MESPNTAPAEGTLPVSPGLAGFAVCVPMIFAGHLIAHVLSVGQLEGTVFARGLACSNGLVILAALVLDARARGIGRMGILKVLVFPTTETLRQVRRVLPLACLALAAGHVLPLLFPVQYTAPPEMLMESFYLNPLSWISILLLAPMAEELMFREFLFRFAVRWGSRVAVASTALVGTLFHLDPAQMISVLPAQLLLSYVRSSSNDVRPCIMLHVGYNVVVLILGVTLTATGLQ